MKKLTIIFLLIAFATGANKTPPRANPQRTEPVAVGEVAPDFTLEDQNGNKVSLSDSRIKNPVVLVFYRASW